jgi:hypothetical protein
VAEECGGRVGGCVGKRGLLTFILEVSEYGIEDSISEKGVVIIEGVVFSSLSTCMYVEALYGVEVGAFLLEL